MAAYIKRCCIGRFADSERVIARLSDAQVEEGMAHHADPTWWESDVIKRENQAYLRRWGAILRREARRRGLL